MTDLDKLRAENQVLRDEIEAHRQREIADLRAQLAKARADATHYRAEAERNAEVGRQLHMAAQEEIQLVRGQIKARDAIPNTRPNQPATQRG